MPRPTRPRTPGPKKPKLLWPRADPAQHNNGWVLDAEFLRKVKEQADRDATALDAENIATVDLEEIEAVLLAVEKVR